MKNKPIIRFAAPKDMTALIDLCAQHAAFEQCDYNPDTKSEALGKTLFSENPPLQCLVVEHNNQLIGYATFMKQYSTWDAAFYMYMDCLFLTADSRGLGIGEDLVNRIKKEAKKTGCTHIQWQTPEFNTRAMKFYRRIGATSKSKERFFLPLENQ